MRKIIVILGILLTVTILISGSAVATWTYVDSVIDEEYTTNPGNIVGTPVSGTEATLGQNAPTQVLGWILVDLGSGHAMPPNQDFTVFAGSSESEQYSVYLLLTLNSEPVYLGYNTDTADHDFTTPSGGSGPTWRYILLEGDTGSISGSDTVYGPDIEGVGWDQP